MYLISDVPENVVLVEGGKRLADIEVGHRGDDITQESKLHPGFKLLGVCRVEEYILPEVRSVIRDLNPRGNPL